MSLVRNSAARLAAEFVVIVVGVLIALAVDQAVQTRADRVAEADYLRALSVDFTETHDLLARQMARLSAARAAGEAVLSDLEGRQQLDDRTLVVAAYHATQSQVNYPDNIVRATYDELAQTDGLLLLRDDGLRRALVGYYRRTEVAAFRARMIPAGFRDLVRGLIPTPVQAVIRSECSASQGAPSTCTSDSVAAVAATVAASLRDAATALPTLRLLVQQIDVTARAIEGDVERTEEMVRRVGRPGSV